MATDPRYVCQICCAKEMCYGNSPNNKKDPQHACMNCGGKVHPWCMGLENIDDDLNCNICVKCNNGKYSGLAQGMQNAGFVIQHPSSSITTSSVEDNTSIFPPMPKLPSAYKAPADNKTSDDDSSDEEETNTAARIRSALQKTTVCQQKKKNNGANKQQGKTRIRIRGTQILVPLSFACNDNEVIITNYPTWYLKGKISSQQLRGGGYLIENWDRVPFDKNADRIETSEDVSKILTDDKFIQCYSEDKKEALVQYKNTLKTLLDSKKKKRKKKVPPAPPASSSSKRTKVSSSKELSSKKKKEPPNSTERGKALDTFRKAKTSSKVSGTVSLDTPARSMCRWQATCGFVNSQGSLLEYDDKDDLDLDSDSDSDSDSDENENKGSCEAVVASAIGRQRSNGSHRSITRGGKKQLTDVEEQGDTLEDEILCIEEAERSDYNVMNKASTFDTDGNMISSATTTGNNFEYSFRDHDHFEAFSALLAEDETGGDGGIPAIEEDEIIGIQTAELQFKFEKFDDGIVNASDDFSPSKNEQFQWAPEYSTLKDDIPEKTWESPLECFMFVSGMDRDYAKRIVSDMNEYAKKKKSTAGRFAGSLFTIFSSDEYWVFMGILLTISLDGRKAGSYQQYWIGTSVRACVGSNEGMSAEVENHSTWAKDFMELKRFQQLLCAFRSIVEMPSNVKDKAAHIRVPIQAINNGSKRTFILGRNVSIDEAGVASRSRYNPIRQYNKDKPNKFRVDFFSTNCPTNYFTYFLDPYQGKNPSEAFIHEDAKSFPTTAKAIANSVLVAGMANDPIGRRNIFCDNRYTSPKLFVFLRDFCKVHAAGTIRKNRKGWDADIMNLRKTKTNRGDSLLTFDKVNGVLAGQWSDSKVVSFISTLNVYGTAEVRRRVGREIKTFTVPRALKEYQENMGGTDRFDQIRECGGGGFSKGIRKFHKWFKTINLAIADIGCANASIAWNMKAETRAGVGKGMYKSPIFAFQTVLARQLLHYKNNRDIENIWLLETAKRHAARSLSSSRNSSSLTRYGNGNHAENFATCFVKLTDAEKKKQVQCKVCAIEERMMQNKQVKTAKGSGSKSSKNLFKCIPCSDLKCAYMHVARPDKSNAKIFELPEFKNMSCFQIYHSTEAEGLWTKNGKLSTKHQVYKKLQTLWANET